MAKPLLADDLWAIVEPLLPPETPKKVGTPRVCLVVRRPWRGVVTLSIVAAMRTASADLSQRRPQPACDHRVEGEDLAPDGLVGDLDAALGKQLLDISLAQREAPIEPAGSVDDVGWEAVAAIGGRGHADRLRRRA